MQQPQISTDGKEWETLVCVPENAMSVDNTSTSRRMKVTDIKGNTIFFETAFFAGQFDVSNEDLQMFKVGEEYDFKSDKLKTNENY